MNRQHPSRHGGRGRDDERHMGFGGPTTQRTRDYDRRSHATQFGEGEAGDDRFPHGHYGRQLGSEGARSDWDEDRYGYPEATSYGREMQRSRDAYRPEGRFAQDDREGFRDTEGSLFRATPSSQGRGGYGDGGYARSEARRLFAGQGVFGGRVPTGQYARQGPKGYRRSDERIKDDVCEHLYHADDVDVAEVSIEVRDGTVLLEGTVPERYMKHRIEDIAEQCIGVADVENRIRVNRDSGRAMLGSGVEENPGENRNNDPDNPRRSGGTATGITSPRH